MEINKKSTSKALFKNTGIIAIGQISTKIVNFFLLPLSLRSLTLIENKKHYVEDYFVYFGKTRSV